MTFRGRHILLLKPPVHIYCHRRATPLREGRQVVILIKTGLRLRPRKVVPLQSNFQKRFSPLPMCPLWPYDNGSQFLLPNFPDTTGKQIVVRAHPIQFEWVRGSGKEIIERRNPTGSLSHTRDPIEGVHVVVFAKLIFNRLGPILSEAIVGLLSHGPFTPCR